MSTDSPSIESRTPKRKKIFFFHGFQLRYICLVAGSLFVLLMFAGLHAVAVAKTSLPREVFEKFQPALMVSTWRLLTVGIMYIGVVTLAAIFLSHRTVGPAYRLEEEIKRMAETGVVPSEIHVREGDEFEGLVGAINKLVDKVRGAKKV